MKKILLILCCFILSFSFSACSADKPEEKDEKYQLTVCGVDLSPWVKEVTEKEDGYVNGEAYYSRRENGEKFYSDEEFPWSSGGKHYKEAEEVLEILSNVETSTPIKSADQITCDDYYVYTIGIKLIDRVNEKVGRTPANLQSFHFVFWNDFNYMGYYLNDTSKPIIVDGHNVYAHSVLAPVTIDDNNVSNIFVVNNPEYIKQVFVDKELYVG